VHRKIRTKNEETDLLWLEGWPPHDEVSRDKGEKDHEKSASLNEDKTDRTDPSAYTEAPVAASQFMNPFAAFVQEADVIPKENIPERRVAIGSHKRRRTAFYF
jgi:hypothetical protein